MVGDGMGRRYYSDQWSLAVYGGERPPVLVLQTSDGHECVLECPPLFAQEIARAVSGFADEVAIIDVRRGGR